MRFYELSLRDPRIPRLFVPPDIPSELEHQTEPWLVPEKLIPAGQRNDRLFKDLTPIKLADFPQRTWHNPPIDDSFQPDLSLKHMLNGRRLLLDEIFSRFPLSHIHDHVRHGYIRYEPAMKLTPRPQCLRCGNTDSFLFGKNECARCSSPCSYCRACIIMGRVSSCAPLLTWHGPQAHTGTAARSHHVLNWNGTLSKAQKKAADAMTEQLGRIHHSQADFLVWAVCGAGKTEMLFPAIHKALQSGVPILLATPRTDVVLELLPRMKAAFPKTVITGLYGGTDADERYSSADLFIATTHQALRFHRYFPLVIIDEVDAFPYSFDDKLKYAMANARAGTSLTVYVTATPPRELQQRARKGSIPHVKVARRYHGHDLPVPRFRWAGNWRKKLMSGRLPAALISWLAGHLDNNKQVFLFVPRINMMPDIMSQLKQALHDERIETVHAEDPERTGKVKAFRQGGTRILITTTILERGVTVKGVQVAVLGAEDRIFSESTLVQIAGRAGRSPDEPDGDVTYFYYGKTKAMIHAKRHIQLMNGKGDD